MKSKILVVTLSLSLILAVNASATAGVLGYSMDRAGRGFAEPSGAEPSAAKVAADALIARPLGLGLTIAGTGVFLVTLPMSISSGSTSTAAEALIVKPGGYTFVKPFGRPDPRFMERRLFGP